MLGVVEVPYSADACLDNCGTVPTADTSVLLGGGDYRIHYPSNWTLIRAGCDRRAGERDVPTSPHPVRTLQPTPEQLLGIADQLQ